MNFTIVLGVDREHFGQLQIAWATWRKHKPGLFDHPILIFYDSSQVDPRDIRTQLYPNEYQIVPWSPPVASFPGTPGDKWSDPQRHKMLAGFVHVPAAYVRTDYWLKLDADTIATGRDDWIDSDWFKAGTGIVAHKWGLTKPPHQMLELDQWAESFVISTPPLRLFPQDNENKLRHKRIISWCGFFSTELTKFASAFASGSARSACPSELPVCSQDGYMWYLAKRFRYEIVRVNMKSCGWDHCSSTRRLMEKAKEVIDES